MAYGTFVGFVTCSPEYVRGGSSSPVVSKVSWVSSPYFGNVVFQLEEYHRLKRRLDRLGLHGEERYTSTCRFSLESDQVRRLNFCALFGAIGHPDR